MSEEFDLTEWARRRQSRRPGRTAHQYPLTAARVRFIEGVRENGTPMELKDEGNYAFWTHWEAFEGERLFRFLSTTRYAANEYRILRRPRVTDDRAWIEIQDHYGGIGSIELRKVAELPVDQSGIQHPIFQPMEGATRPTSVRPTAPTMSIEEVRQMAREDARRTRKRPGAMS